MFLSLKSYHAMGSNSCFEKARRTESDVMREIDVVQHADALHSGRNKHGRHGGGVTIVAVIEGDVAGQAVEVLQHPPDTNSAPRVPILVTGINLGSRGIHNLLAHTRAIVAAF
jgi:hypothetical protein